MKAYRVHHRTSTEIGPYNRKGQVKDPRSSRLLEALRKNTDINKSHPIPVDDNMSKPFGEEHSFGVLSLQMLEQWFAAVYAELFDDDYVVSVFEINENTSSFGDNQVAFVLSDAFVIETLEFTDLV